MKRVSKQALDPQTDLPTAVEAPLEGLELHQALQALVGVAQLESVDVVEVAAVRKYGDRPVGQMALPDDCQAIIGAPQYHYPTTASKEGAAVLASIGVQYKDGAGEVYAELQLKIRVQYGFVGLERAPSVHLVAKLAEDLGLHHAWPYLRERLQTLSQWLGLPPVVLPLRKR